MEMDKMWDSEKEAWVDLPDEPIVIDDDEEGQGKKRGREEVSEEEERKKAKTSTSTSPADAAGPSFPSASDSDSEQASPPAEAAPAASPPAEAAPAPYSGPEGLSSLSSEMLGDSLAQPVYNMPNDVLRLLGEQSPDQATALETRYAVRQLYARSASVGEIGWLLRDEATLPISKGGDRLTLGEILVRAGIPKALPDEGGRDVMWWKRKLLHAVKVLRWVSFALPPTT